jgi:hypothetical protein
VTPLAAVPRPRLIGVNRDQFLFNAVDSEKDNHRARVFGQFADSMVLI